MSVLVKCIHCGNEETVDFTYCLGNGWPKCCGYTMRLITKAKEINIDDAVRRVLDKGMMAHLPPSSLSLRPTVKEEEV